MFELIRANKRRSAMLMLVMLALLLLLGFAIGFAVLPGTGTVDVGAYRYYIPVGGLLGMFVAFLLWGVQALAAYASGDRLLMAAAGAREIQKSDHPRLFNVVEEMSLAAGLPAAPKVYIIEDMSLNAFAAGRDPNHAAVAVTAGLLSKLNRDQLQGVVAHEIAHIANRDVLFMTIAGIMVGSIIMLAEIFTRMMWYSNMGASRRYRSSRSESKGGGAQALMLLAALVLSIVAPLIAQLLYFACSRQREYLADAGGAVYTRYPEGLAGALEVISANPGDKERISKATAPMYIINPLQAGSRSLAALTSTHPPVEERIRILRSMAGGASYGDYAAAWRKVSGDAADRMPASAFTEANAALRPARQASPSAAPMGPEGAEAVMAAAAAQPEPSARLRHRDTGDLLRRMNQFRFVNCDCGLKLKIPPEYKKPHVRCARCGKVHALAP